MGEAIAAIGATAALVQLINYSVGGVNGLYDISSRARSAPLTLQQWDDEVQGFLRLAAVLEAEPFLQKGEAHGILRRYTDDANALRPSLQELSVGDKDGWFTRLMKKAKVIFKEREITRRLDAFRHRSDNIHKLSMQ